MEVPHLPATARCLAGIAEQTVAKFREEGAQGRTFRVGFGPKILGLFSCQFAVPR